MLSQSSATCSRHNILSRLERAEVWTPRPYHQILDTPTDGFGSRLRCVQAYAPNLHLTIIKNKALVFSTLDLKDIFPVTHYVNFRESCQLVAIQGRECSGYLFVYNGLVSDCGARGWSVLACAGWCSPVLGVLDSHSAPPTRPLAVQHSSGDKIAPYALRPLNRSRGHRSCRRRRRSRTGTCGC